MAKIEEIEGIGAVYAGKLGLAGITTCETLLAQGATPAGRKKIGESTGISEALLLRWVNHADLFRISGVGQQYAELLEAAGVDSIPELAQRNAANLHQKLAELQEHKKLTGRAPALSQVEDWIQQAKQLPRLVTY
jgi:predicted flap endonuclease-1-like 5' DNA nuclease